MMLKAEINDFNIFIRGGGTMKRLLSNLISFLPERAKAKMILLTLFGLLGLSQIAMAEDPVYFPDANLKADVEWALGITNPTPTDMLALTVLELFPSERISDLTGIEYASNLRYMWVYTNLISDLSPLSGLANLTVLDISQNPINDLSPLSGLTNLTELILVYSQSSDLSPLSGLAKLTTLCLIGNQINDLSPLSGLTNLTIMSLFENQISDISPLSGLTSLESLWLHNNLISDLSPLSGLTNMTDLQLGDNRISDISPLSGLTSLEELDLHRNPLNEEAYCTYLPLIERNNLGIYHLGYDSCPYSDVDEDGAPDICDNCPSDYNPLQEDSYPPGGNGCGDACECHTDCNYDQKVDLSDLVSMKQEFLRTDCATTHCNADCNYDNRVDLADLVMMKGEFFRTDCPMCP